MEEGADCLISIQNLEIYNDINIDQRALEGFVPKRYLKDTDLENEFKVKFDMSELLDPVYMPVKWKGILDRGDVIRHWRESHLNMWRALLDRMYAVEHDNLSDMRKLDKCKYFFENFNWPTDSLISSADTETVFFNSNDIVNAVATFVKKMENVLGDDWVLGTISDVYENLIKHDLYLFNSYADNRPKAQQILETKGGVQIFNGIIKEELPEIKRTFTDLLDAPIIMRSRIYYSLKILFNFTMMNHPDYTFLKELLLILYNNPGICSTSDDDMIALPIKSGYVVQQVKKIRKLRYLFLFPNYLIVTSLKLSSGTFQYKVKDIIHLGNNTVNSTTDAYIRDIRDRNIRRSKKVLNRAKDALRTCLICPTENRGQLFKWKINKLVKKIFKYECIVSLLMPHLRLIVTDIDNEQLYYFIFSSYFQQELWKNTLNENDYLDTDIEEFLNCIRQYSQISQIPDFQFAVDSIRYYNGTLDVLVHQVQSLEENTDSYITLESDSFGGYYSKLHKTDVVIFSQSPVYDENFEISLCCSENLKVSLYTRPSSSEDSDFTLNFTGLLNGHAHNLRTHQFTQQTNLFYFANFMLFQQFENTSISNVYKFVLVSLYPSVKRTAAALSVRFTSNLNDDKRKMSLLQWEALDYILSMRGPVFGEAIDDISERERRDIPLIVESCVQLIEERGLDVENIYIIPGEVEHVEELMGVFNLCCFTGALSIKDRKYSVHDVTTLFKEYFMSLPSPLLDNPKFYGKAADIKAVDVQVKTIRGLLRTLPEPNQSIFDYIIAHLVKVCQNQNKNKVSTSVISKALGFILLGIPNAGNSQDSVRKDIDTFIMVLELSINAKLNKNIKSRSSLSGSLYSLNN